MPVVCVLIDHFPYKLEVRRHPELAGLSVLVFQRDGSRRTVLDMSPDTQGVVPGMSLQEALARCRDAALVETNVTCYQEAFSQVLSSLGEWSPVVEAAEFGCAYVGLDGLEETYGGEQQLIDGLIQAVPSYLAPRLGVSRGKFPAYLAAMCAEPGRAHKTPADITEFVAGFPVEVLPVPWEVKDRLRGFGLETLGDIARLPIGPLQAQFGPTGARTWHLARGTDDTPIQPQQAEEQVSASFAFSTPTASLEPLLLATDSLLAKLFARPEMRGRCARVALLEAAIVDRPSWQRRIVFKTPVGGRRQAYSILRSVLENTPLPGPVEEVRLTLQALTGESGRQEGLFREVRQRDRLRQAMAQLKAAQGKNPIYQVREVEPWSRMPERQRALVIYEP